jgi:putative FmdB family regulatory protein
MPIYLYRCDCGLRFERLMSLDEPVPLCPQCGGQPRKIPAGFSLGKGSSETSAKDKPTDRLAPPWQAMAGNPEKIQREVEFRKGLAEKHAGGALPGGPDTRS